jgi:hypothetical protein
MDKDGNIIGPVFLIVICSIITIYLYRKGWFKTHPEEDMFSKFIAYRPLIILLVGVLCGIILLIRSINYHIVK